MADRHIEQGLLSYERRDFDRAVLHFLEGVRGYQAEDRLAVHPEVLVYLAQTYEAIGQYRKALTALTETETIFRGTGNRAGLAAVLNTMGNVHLALGHPDVARASLQEAQSLADPADTGVIATILNNLGNTYSRQARFAEAIPLYTESYRRAADAASAAAAIHASINLARAYGRSGQHHPAWEALDQARHWMEKTEDSSGKAFDLIAVGLGYAELRAPLPDASGELLRKAVELLSEAATMAESRGDSRSASYAWGYLGSLYESERRYDDALDLTKRAIASGLQADAGEALYRWEWQAGRVLRVLERAEEAIDHYRRAVEILQRIRPEMAYGYAVADSSFQETVGPVYFELADLLLRHAATLPDRRQETPYLLQARETVELLKAAELRDYFRDDCVDAALAHRTRLEDVSKRAAVLYPILLRDRTELLVSLPSGLTRFTVPVTADAMKQEVDAFRHMLEKRTTRQYLPHARQLYEWLIRPFERELADSAVDTLVVVPDGALRTIPLAALHDGEQFLIAKYAIATTPGLNLTDPRPFPENRRTVKALAAGLTQAVQGFPALPHVGSELRAIHDLYTGDLLIDQVFATATVEAELKDKPFTIVHIASHGKFEGEVTKTFLLTFDGKLTMDRLDELVGSTRLRETPLELLTLSACETAAGDDRAALGLAGIAIKAGARSALATLWFINDEASSVLVTEFYRQLQQPGISKAVALQRAQVKLMSDRRYQHPVFWAAFLLLNNWL
ncbi:CHAT domain-containing protein [Candidatus Nitrospira bockiana]